MGPQSAGASPGPVCYGMGNRQPTVTDANLALGYLNPTALAGGAVPIDAAVARRAIEERVARRLASSVHDAAFGVHSIATDSEGNIYTTETYEGKRLQKFVYKGIGPVTARDQGVVWPTQ